MVASTLTVVFGVSCRVGLVHPKRNDHSGQNSEGSDSVNGGGDGDQVGEDASKKCADHSENPDAADGEAGAEKEDREQAPCKPVVEIVDQPGL